MDFHHSLFCGLHWTFSDHNAATRASTKRRPKMSSLALFNVRECPMLLPLSVYLALQRAQRVHDSLRARNVAQTNRGWQSEIAQIETT